MGDETKYLSFVPSQVHRSQRLISMNLLPQCPKPALPPPPHPPKIKMLIDQGQGQQIARAQRSFLEICMMTEEDKISRIM